MAQKRVKTSFIGVYFRTTTNPNRIHNGRPDRAFDFIWRDENGKQRWQVAGWASEGMTAQAAYRLRLERVVIDRKKRKATAPGGQQSSLQASPARQPVSELLFSDIAENYLRWLEKESRYADRERIRYETHIKDPLGNLPANAITSIEAGAIKHVLLSKMSVGSVQKNLNLCRAIYFHAISTGSYSGRNPFSCQNGLKMPKGATVSERFLTPEEARVLLDELAKRSPQLRDMCYVSLLTGIRPCELFSLRGGDLAPQAGFFWVDGKGGKREKVATSKEILDLLNSYRRKPNEYIFQTKSGGKIKQTSDTLRRTVEDLGLCPRTVKQVGRKEVRIKLSLEEKKEHQRKKIWLHTFRHTFASWLAQSGTVTLLELKALLRHESTRITERYAHLIPGELVEQSSVIHEILEKAQFGTPPKPRT